jgi:CheY-like chemotaxis protein
MESELPQANQPGCRQSVYIVDYDSLKAPRVYFGDRQVQRCIILVRSDKLPAAMQACQSAGYQAARFLAKPIAKLQLLKVMLDLVNNPKRLDVNVVSTANSAAANEFGPVKCQAASSARQLRVLFVDDNAVNRRIGKAMLSRLGVCTQVAESGSDAIKIRKASDVDIIFMDR